MSRPDWGCALGREADAACAPEVKVCRPGSSELGPASTGELSDAVGLPVSPDALASTLGFVLSEVSVLTAGLARCADGAVDAREGLTLSLLLLLAGTFPPRAWLAATADPNRSSLFDKRLDIDPGVRLPKLLVGLGWKKMPAGLPSGLWIIIPLAPLLPILAAVSLKYSSASAGRGLLGDRCDEGPIDESCDLPDMPSEGCMQ